MAIRTGYTTWAPATNLRTIYTTPLLNMIVPGAKIEAYHINLLADFINQIALHTHILDEYSVIHEFGNTQTNSTAFTTRATNSSNIAQVSYPATAGSTITAAHHAILRNGANDAKVHSHTFTDDIP